MSSVPSYTGIWLFLFHFILLCLDNLTVIERWVSPVWHWGSQLASVKTCYVVDVCVRTCVHTCMCAHVHMCMHVHVCVHTCMHVCTHIYESTTQTFPFGSLISLLSHAFGIHYPWASGASGPVPWLTVIWFIEIIWQGNRPWKTELWEAHLMNFLWFESGFILPCGGADTPEHTQPAWEPSEEWRLWQ